MATRQAGFCILVATDGSAQAGAAIATAVDAPWPARTQVRAIVARQSGAPHRRSILLSSLDRSADDAAARARHALAGRWPAVEAVVADKSPVEGVLSEAERFRADVIVVVGWRGYGAVRRLLMGSVSRGVVRRAKCAVLVVRRRPLRMRRIVIGFDASPHALRAVTLVGKLVPPRDGSVILVSVVELLASLTRAGSWWHSIDGWP